MNRILFFLMVIVIISVGTPAMGKGSNAAVSMLLMGSSGSGKLNDFNGSGAADLALYNNASSKWYIRTLAGVQLAWDRVCGVSGGVAIPADYSGDGVTDLGVYHPGSGKWYAQSVSGENIMNGFSCSRPNSIAMAFDYDGDGKADLVFFDYTTAQWYIKGVDGKDIAWTTPVLWGIPSETRSWDNPPSQTVIPVPFDYDQDGRVDLAIYKRGLSMDTSYWSISYRAGGDVKYTWGSSGSIPCPGLYRSQRAGTPSGISIYKITSAEFYIPGDPAAIAMGIYGQTLPVGGCDFSGSGWADNAVYNYQSGTWDIRFNVNGSGYNSSYPQSQIAMSISGATPANIYSAILAQSGYTTKPW